MNLKYTGFDWSPHYKKHEVKEGDIVCLHCEGTGIYPPSKVGGYGLKNCEKCAGTGYFDWVEVVVGKGFSLGMNCSGYSAYSGYEK